MNRDTKVEMTKALKDKFSRAKVAIFADYKGLKSSQADELRRALRTTQTEVKVLKNNIARLVMKDGSPDQKLVVDATVGPTLVAFAYGDMANAAKVMAKFAKENEALKLKDSLMGDRRINVAEVNELASLPPREVLLAKVLGTMIAPVSSFVGVLAAVPRSLVTVLSAIEKKKTNS